MKSSTILLIIAVCLVVIGVIIGVCAFIVARFDIANFSNSKYDYFVYKYDEKITDIKIITLDSHVTLVPSDDGVCRIECNENEKTPHKVTLTDGVLKITAEDNRKWFDFISIFGDSNGEITVYLPEKDFSGLEISNETGDIHLPESFSFESATLNGSTGDIEILSNVKKDLTVKLSTGDIFARGIDCLSAEFRSSTGDIKLENVKSQSFIKAEATTGDISLYDIECVTLYAKRSTGETDLKRVTASGDIEIYGTTDDATLDTVNAARLKINLSTGDATLSDTVASESIDIHCSTGSVELHRCDSASVYIETSTGNIFGSFLSGKNFDALAKTGDVSVPKDSTGGTCIARASTGDIKFTVIE